MLCCVAVCSADASSIKYSQLLDLCGGGLVKPAQMRRIRNTNVLRCTLVETYTAAVGSKKGN